MHEVERQMLAAAVAELLLHHLLLRLLLHQGSTLPSLGWQVCEIHTFSSQKLFHYIQLSKASQSLVMHHFYLEIIMYCCWSGGLVVPLFGVLVCFGDWRVLIII